MAIWNKELYGTGRCINCGFLGKRSPQFDEVCFHASGKDRISGKFSRHHTLAGGETSLTDTIPWCFVGKGDFLKELGGIQATVFTGFQTNLGYLFPILFVTVACGAISGFHCLVSSGTTSKQLSSEAHIKPIGYGSMMLEGLLAVIALTTVAYLLLGDYTALLKEVGWGGVFSQGIGNFLTALGIPLAVGIGFGGLVLSAFALTTLDTATRLTRFMLVELTEKEEGKPAAIVTLVTNRWVAGAISVALATWLALSGGWSTLWPLFGTANQLLASLTLLAVVVWLSRTGKDNKFVLYPMIFMLAVTLTALVFMFFKTLAAANIVQVIVVVVLFILAIILVYMAITRLRAVGKQKPATA